MHRGTLLLHPWSIAEGDTKRGSSSKPHKLQANGHHTMYRSAKPTRTADTSYTNFSWDSPSCSNNRKRKATKRGRLLIGRSEMDQLLSALRSDTFTGEFDHKIHGQYFDPPNDQFQDLNTGIIGTSIVCSSEDASSPAKLKRSLSSVTLESGECFDTFFQAPCKKMKFHLGNR